MITIERYSAGMESGLSQLVRKVYDEFVADDYTDEGNQFFYQWISAENIASRQSAENNIFVAYCAGELAGMIEIRSNENISLLFVDKQYQGKGIARKLFGKALEMCRNRNPKLSEFYVHASLFSVPVYEKLGFEKMDEMQEEHGITYLPMKTEL